MSPKGGRSEGDSAPLLLRVDMRLEGPWRIIPDQQGGDINMKLFALVAAVTVVVLSACASTGYVSTFTISVPKTVTLSTALDPEVAPFAPRFIAILAQHGFVVGNSNDPHAMQLRLDFNGNPFNMRVGAALWHDGAPILTASATNSGWGTALARGSAVQNLADSCATTFERELSQLQPYLRIIDSRGPVN